MSRDVMTITESEAQAIAPGMEGAGVGDVVVVWSRGGAESATSVVVDDSRPSDWAVAS